MSLKGVSGKVWEIKEDLIVKEKAKIDQLIDVLLENRGIKGKEEKKNFLRPPHPLKIKASEIGLDKKSLDEVVLKIRSIGKKLIVIYGDYDADGITATAILWEALYSLGFNTLPYLPDRSKEGYGIKARSVADIKRKHPDLGMVITVDNGIVAVNEVKKIKEMGIDVVVTDHHKKGKKLPPADVIIHSKEVSGAGVSWFLSRFLKNNLEVKNSFYDNDGLDLLVIGTVADQMPLVGINRSIVKYGIEAINNTKRKGLLELFKEAGIAKGKIGTYEMNYVIAPRINAVGRISHALESLRLLCTKDSVRASELALHLGRINRERQKIVDELFEKSRVKVQAEIKNKVLVIRGRGYNEGVIGLVAGKLAEEFCRPAIVISEKKGVSKASARSVADFDITEALRKIDYDFESLGGHSMAAGFSLKTGKISEFKEKFIDYVNKVIEDNLLVPKIYIDSRLDFRFIDSSFLRRLSLFEPLGMGNPSPLFLSCGVRVLEVKNIGKDSKHLRLVLSQSDKVFEAVAFGFGDFLPQLSNSCLIDIVFSVGENTWNGFTTIELKLKDFKFT